MASVQAPLPRITIQFCTQCKWMLRAAYFAQELLSTFSTALGEVALQPSTGGTFVVTLYQSALSETVPTFSEPVYQEVEQKEVQIQELRNELLKDGVKVQSYVLWDRKVEGGFPETKELKRRVRDIIDPGRDLGHVDGKKKSVPAAEAAPSAPKQQKPNIDQALSNAEVGKQKTGTQPKQEEQNLRSLPRPESKLQSAEGEDERRVTSLYVDVQGEENPEKEKQIDPKRNPDGSICEDCN